MHTDDEIRQLLSEITGERVDPSNEIRPPFFTDNGFNTHLGKHIFINTGVAFADLGGIYIEDNVLIGPGAKLRSINHPIPPARDGTTGGAGEEECLDWRRCQDPPQGDGR